MGRIYPSATGAPTSGATQGQVHYRLPQFFHLDKQKPFVPESCPANSPSHLTHTSAAYGNARETTGERRTVVHFTVAAPSVGAALQALDSAASPWPPLLLPQLRPFPTGSNFQKKGEGDTDQEAFCFNSKLPGVHARGGGPSPRSPWMSLNAPRALVVGTPSRTVFLVERSAGCQPAHGSAAPLARVQRNTR